MVILLCIFLGKELLHFMNQLSLLIILLAALVIPLAMARFKITFLPTAVVEIIVGVFLGPSLFNWITDSNTLDILQTSALSSCCF